MQRLDRATTPTDADPLAVGHVQVEVTETDAGFMVLIQSPYAHEAREILRRANNLLAKETERSSHKLSNNTEEWWSFDDATEWSKDHHFSASSKDGH
jgi:hypothetical protein